MFNQSDYLIQVFDTNSQTQWQTVQIQITGFFRSQLIWIYTDYKDRVCPGSAGLGLNKTKVAIFVYLMSYLLLKDHLRTSYVIFFVKTGIFIHFNLEKLKMRERYAEMNIFAWWYFT